MKNVRYSAHTNIACFLIMVLLSLINISLIHAEVPPDSAGSTSSASGSIPIGDISSSEISPSTSENENTVSVPIDNASSNQTSSSENVPEVRELDLGVYDTEMYVGSTQLLSITPIPQNASIENMIFSSSDSEIASINGLGRIQALREGQCQITVSLSGLVQSFELTINIPVSSESPIEDIILEGLEDTLYVGNKVRVGATIIPSTARTEKIQFSIDDETIATITNSGTLSLHKSGMTLLTVKAGTFEKKTTIIVNVQTTRIVPNISIVMLQPGENTKISVEVFPEDAPQAVNYQVKNTMVASVSPLGVVEGISEGTTMIIASNGELQQSISVIVAESWARDNNTPLLESFDMAENGFVHNTVELIKTSQTNPIVVSQSDLPWLTNKVLVALHDSKKKLAVQSDNITIYLDGSKITNDENSISTNIDLVDTDMGISFTLNENLPGEIALEFSDTLTGYLYIYNNAKEQYLYVGIISEDAPIELQIKGTYLISSEKPDKSIKEYLFPFGVFTVVLLFIIVAFSIKKKAYWFW